MQGLFLPGFGLRAKAYAEGLPEGWSAVDLPRFSSFAVRAGGEWGVFEPYRLPLEEALEKRGPVVLGGHSLGCALAVKAAAARPDLVSGLVLLSPAGLPLSRLVPWSVGRFALQVLSRPQALKTLHRPALDVVGAPLKATRVALATRRLDLGHDLAFLSGRVPARVVSGRGDTITPPKQGRRIAELLQADHEEVARGGHLWMFADFERMRRELAVLSP